MFHLPDDEWECQDCKSNWMAEYGRGEKVECHDCKSENVKKVNYVVKHCCKCNKPLKLKYREDDATRRICKTCKTGGNQQ